MYPFFNELSGKRILITGHTGFSGSWATVWLRKLGCEISGYSLPPETSPNLYQSANLHTTVHSTFADIRDIESLSACFQSFRPDLVLHLAAQPLVRRSYRLPSQTFEVNVQGTVNVLEMARKTESVRGVLCVTTDKVYKNSNSGKLFVETDELGGSDPYSASKSAAEMVVSSYRKSFFQSETKLVVARGGNIIGGGDWSEDRLIPDLIRAWGKGEPLKIRNPNSTRPWQHVLGLIDGYVKILGKMLGGGSPEALENAYNFGPLLDEKLTVEQVLELATLHLKNLEITVVHSDLREANELSLDSSLARQNLGWMPPWDTKASIKETMDWYKAYYSGEDALKLCEEQIESWRESERKNRGRRS